MKHYSLTVTKDIDLKSAHPSDHDVSVSAQPTADVILDALGLARKRSRTVAVLSAVGYVAAGAIVGSALTFLFAPTSGAALRARLSRGAKGAAGNMKHGFMAAKDTFDETLEAGISEIKTGKHLKDGDGHTKGHHGKAAE